MLNRIRNLSKPKSESRDELADRVMIRGAVVCQICGGLANQMICYKLGRYLSERLGFSLILDASWYSGQQADDNRNFQLGFFNLRYDMILFSKKIIDDIKASNELTVIAGEAVKDFASPEVKASIRRELEGSPANLYCDLWCALALRDEVGHFVSSSDILSELTLDLDRHFADPDFRCLKKIQQSGNPIAIHVRRGDFATHDGNLLLRSDYYNKAIGKLETQLDDTSFFVFSDDIDWCKQNLRSSRSELTFVDFNDQRNGYKDMVLASKCKHFILSNASTFSHQIIELSGSNEDTIIIRSSKEDREQSVG